MLSTFLRFLLVGIWLAASVLLGTSTVVHHQAIRIASAVIVGLPGALRLGANVKGLSGPGEDTKQRVRRILQSTIVDLATAGVSGEDVVGISLHVWLVPPWYRFLFPYQLRSRLRRKSTLARLARRLRLRPKLLCLARYRIQPHDPSGLSFRIGAGLVGRCVAQNQAGRIHVVKLSTPAFKSSVADETRWKEAPITTTYRLDREEAESLARIYSEAAALVIRDASGDALGCVTLEFAADSALHLPQANKKVAKTNIYFKHLRTAADLVQTQLRHGGDS